MSALPRPPLARVRESLGLRAPEGQALASAFWRAWCILACGGLGGGLLWRFSGGAPAPRYMLAGLSLALMLAAFWLAPALSGTLKRQARHTRLPVLPFIQALLNSARFAELALLLALAPCGLLLSYNAQATVLSLMTLDLAAMNISLWLFTLACLLLAGPALVMISLTILHGVRCALGIRYGTLAWLLSVALAHIYLVAPGGWPPWRTPLHAIARWAALQTSSSSAVQLYTMEIVGQLLGASLALLAAAVVLLALVQYLPRAPEARLPAMWVASCTGLAVAALRTFSMYEAWLRDSGLQLPGDWRQLVGCGLVAAWIAYALIASADSAQRAPDAGSDLAWLGYLWLSLLALTFPARLADQASREEILLTCLVSFVVLVGGVLLIRCAALLQRQLAWLALPALALSLLLLAFPYAEGQPPLALTLAADLSRGLQSAERLQAAAITLGGMTLAAALGWALLYARRRRAVAAQQL